MSRVRDVLTLAVVATPFVVGHSVAAAATAAAEEEHRVAFVWQDPEIVESSGLAVVDGLFVTVNDSGDAGRVFVVDPESGRTVGTTRWSPEPVDVEALAPTPDGDVLVGDIGGNNVVRDRVEVLQVPVGREDREVEPVRHTLVYPDGTHDAEVLMVHPVTGRVYVVSKDFDGGTVYEAPRRLGDGGTHPLTDIGFLPGYLTDGAFFPDGKHVVVRKYVDATVHEWPSLRKVADLALPPQEQGEAIAVAPDGRVFVSTEGQFSDVHRVTVPEELQAVVNPEPAEPTEPTGPTEPTEPADPSEPATPTDDADQPDAEQPGAETEADDVVVRRPAWLWWAGGVVGIGLVVILVRSLRPR